MVGAIPCGRPLEAGFAQGKNACSTLKRVDPPWKSTHPRGETIWKNPVGRARQIPWPGVLLTP